MIYRYFFAAVLATAIGCSGLKADATPGSGSSKKTTAKTTTTKSSTSHKASSKTGSRSRHVVAKRKSGPSYQTQPTEERYKEIQQALAEKGFFKGEVNGKWGTDSADALKNFQAQNKLANDGKINSLSLIALGLGPKHDGTTAQTAPSAGTPETTPASQSVPAAATAPPTPPQP